MPMSTSTPASPSSDPRAHWEATSFAGRYLDMRLQDPYPRLRIHVETDITQRAMRRVLGLTCLVCATGAALAVMPAADGVTDVLGIWFVALILGVIVALFAMVPFVRTVGGSLMAEHWAQNPALTRLALDLEAHAVERGLPPGPTRIVLSTRPEVRGGAAEARQGTGSRELSVEDPRLVDTPSAALAMQRLLRHSLLSRALWSPSWMHWSAVVLTLDLAPDARSSHCRLRREIQRQTDPRPRSPA